MKHDAVVTNDFQFKLNRELRSRYVSPLIKWYNTTMSKSEKYRLGLMTYEEFMEWQQELAEKQQAKLEAEEKAASEATSGEGSDESYGHTFWENDDGDRENISDKDYMAFLEENHIDLGSKAALDYL